jgi:two-component system, LytTR family, sensor kinase
MFNNKYRYIFILVLAVYSFINSLFSEVYKYYNIRAPRYDILLVFVLMSLLIWEGNRWIGYRIEKTARPGHLVKSLGIFFICGIIWSSLVSLIMVYWMGSIVLGMKWAELRVPAILIFTYGSRINLFMHIVNAIFFYNRQYKTKELEAEELKRINTQAQLQAIKNQINPHFLFNNLNVLSSMVMQENPEANRFIEEFSKVYRHVLNNQQKELIPLQEEIESLKPYLFLLEKRFPESIFIEINIPEEYQAFLIIPVSVQMLIENAIKHNVASRARPLKLQIKAENHRFLSVSNNLQVKLGGEPSTRIGLKNISQRYDIITGKHIEIINTGKQFIVLIPLIIPE